MSSESIYLAVSDALQDASIDKKIYTMGLFSVVQDITEDRITLEVNTKTANTHFKSEELFTISEIRKIIKTVIKAMKDIGYKQIVSETYEHNGVYHWVFNRTGNY
jgi:hypothetical protein